MTTDCSMEAQLLCGVCGAQIWRVRASFVITFHAEAFNTVCLHCRAEQHHRLRVELVPKDAVEKYADELERSRKSDV